MMLSGSFFVYLRLPEKNKSLYFYIIKTALNQGVRNVVEWTKLVKYMLFAYFYVKNALNNGFARDIGCMAIFAF